MKQSTSLFNRWRDHPSDEVREYIVRNATWLRFFSFVKSCARSKKTLDTLSIHIDYLHELRLTRTGEDEQATKLRTVRSLTNEKKRSQVAILTKYSLTSYNR